MRVCVCACVCVCVCVCVCGAVSVCACLCVDNEGYIAHCEPREDTCEDTSPSSRWTAWISQSN